MLGGCKCEERAGQRHRTALFSGICKLMGKLRGNMQSHRTIRSKVVIHAAATCS